ncbi:MAG TPA: hypothetical protein VM429_09960, partial [Micropruina sp.]|nr:hypothetical protein [Micropruina sp.]
MAIAVVVALLAGPAAVTNVPTLSGANPVKTHPAPDLFPQAVVEPFGADLHRQQARADRAFSGWAATHSGRDDAAFTEFALS